MKTTTPSQWIAATICALCLIALGLIYFFPSKGNELATGMIVTAFITAFGRFSNFLTGNTVSSETTAARSATHQDKLIEAVANSTPVIPTTPVKVVAPIIPPIPTVIPQV